MSALKRGKRTEDFKLYINIESEIDQSLESILQNLIMYHWLKASVAKGFNFNKIKLYKNYIFLFL